MFGDLDHIGFIVGDFDEAAAWVRESLGLPFARTAPLPQYGVDAGQEQLLCPHDRGDSRHAVGRVLPAVGGPLPAGLTDRVKVERAGHRFR